MKKISLLFAVLSLTTGSALAGIKPIPANNINPELKFGAEASMGADGRAKEKASAEASGTLDWGYAGNPVGAYYLTQAALGDVVYLAIKIPAADCELLAGNKITSINITTGTSSNNNNPIKKVFPFITTNLEASEYEMLGSFSLGSDKFTEYRYALETPFEITPGKDIYVGYYFGWKNCSYIPVDGQPTSGDTESCIFGYQNGIKTRPTNFQNASEEIGSLCLSATVEGTNLPKNLLNISSSSFPLFVTPDKSFEYQLELWNRGTEPVNSITVNTEIAGIASEQNIQLDKTLNKGDKCEISVSAINSVEGVLLPVTSQITKLGDNTNSSTQNHVSTTLNSYNNGYPRKIVMEEATGTWCTYCPAGFAMIDYIEKNYADDFLIVGVHSGDDMAVQSWSDWGITYVPGFPFALFNRYYGMTPSYYTQEEIYEYADEIAGVYKNTPSYGEISLACEVDEENHVVNMTAETSFIVSTQIPHYLAFAISEDGMGPFIQTNTFYTDNAHGEMGGWESRPKYYEMEYDHVARELVGFPGIANSLPATIEKNEKLSYTATVPLTNVTSPNFNAIAYIISGYSGEIINATSIPVQWSAVESIEAENPDMEGAGTVYTLDGRIVKSENLSNGLYIMVKNGKATKVLVK